MSKKNDNMIYIWKVVFTYLVALFHFDNIYRISWNYEGELGWYIAVEFFFIVSGYLLYQHAVPQKEKYPSAVRYITDRYFHIYPIYLMSFLITFLFWSGGGLRNRVSQLVDSFWELVGLQSVGLNRGWTDVNPTSWYVSTLLIVSFFLFFLLRHYERITVDFLIPVFVMVIYSWFYRYKGNLDVVIEMEGFYMNGALFRGLADMGLGVVAVRLNRYLQEHGKRFLLWKVAGVLGFLFVILYSTTHGATNKDFILAIILTVCVAIGFLPNEKWEVPGFVKRWSKACLGVYLLHEVFRTYLFPSFMGVPEKISDRVVVGAIYFMVITAAGILLTVVSEYLKKLILKCRGFLLA